MGLLQRNVAQTVSFFVFDHTTGAPVTGDAANITIRRSENGAALATLSAPNVTEISASDAPGYYTFDVAGTEVDAADYVDFFGVSSTSSNYRIIIPRQVLYPAGLLDDDRLLYGALDLPATPIADTVYDALKRAAVGLPPSAPGASGGLPLYDDLFSIVLSGTVDDATPTAGDFDLSAGFSTTAGLYKGMWLVFTSGILKGIARKITDYTAARNAQFSGSAGDADAPFPAAPANGDGVALIGFHGS